MATRTKHRPLPRVWDNGKYEVGFNPGCWAYCTASSDHHPQPQYMKGERDEADLPPCNCGAPQKFGYPAWVTKIVKTVSFGDERLARDLGIGGFRHVERVEMRHFKLKRQAEAWTDRMIEKYRKKR